MHYYEPYMLVVLMGCCKSAHRRFRHSARGAGAVCFKLLILQIAAPRFVSGTAADISGVSQGSEGGFR